MQEAIVMRRYHLDIHELWSAVRQQGGYRSVRKEVVPNLVCLLGWVDTVFGGLGTACSTCSYHS